MRILWFPRLQFDIDKLHITTWREMYREMEEKGTKVKIAIAGNEKNGTWNRPYIRIPVIKTKFLRILTFWINGYVKFLHAYLTFKPEVVILDIFTFWFSFPVVLFSKHKVVFIIDNRTPFYGLNANNIGLREKIMRYYTKIAFWYCKLFLDGITVINTHYKNHICKDFKFSPSDVGVWNSGVNTEIFSVSGKDDKCKPSLFGNKFILMQHGEFTYERGLFETIEAISLLDKKDIMLVLIGFGKAKTELIQKIKGLNLESRVYILPPMSYYEIPKYIRYCDCGIMPYPDIEYWKNNSPIKLLEYLAMGKVVICTNLLPFRDVMGNNKCAYYINNNEPVLIANAINYCYKNRDLLGKWGNDGIGIVRERYTWGKQAENLIGFISNLRKRF